MTMVCIFLFDKMMKPKMMCKSNNSKLELWYNKSYSYLPTTNQRLDTVLCIRSISDKIDERMYIIDAKYRVCVDSAGHAGPMKEDTNVMRRYRDSIVGELNHEMQFQYKTLGAFPMLPGSISLISDQMEKITNSTKLEAKSQRVLIDEYDDYSKLKLENIMVANVKRQSAINDL